MSTKKIYRGKERNKKEVKNLYFAKNQYAYSHIQEAKLKNCFIFVWPFTYNLGGTFTVLLIIRQENFIFNTLYIQKYYLLLLSLTKKQQIGKIYREWVF